MNGEMFASTNVSFAPAVALAQIGGTRSLVGSGDGAQRFTYPEVLSVPEPGSVAAAAVAFAALALRRRLGRRVRSPALEP